MLKKDEINLLNEVGYVPQKISLNDDTILSNIAIGVKKSEIDYKKIEFVTKVCH